MSTDPTPFFPLLRLANELIDQILEEVDDTQTLRNVALTCFHLNDIVEKYLYRKISITDIWGHRSFLYALEKKPDRAKQVHELRIRRRGLRNAYPRPSKFCSIELPFHLQVLHAMTNLKRLYIKSFKMFPSEIHSIFTRAAQGEILCSLEVCELHLDTRETECVMDKAERGGLNGWIAAAHYFYPVFRHPNLKHLILNNVIGHPGRRAAAKPPTPLERLEILDSELSNRGIKDALTHSSSLKELIVCPYLPFGYPLLGGTDYGAEAFAAVKNSPMNLIMCLGARVRAARPLELHTMAALRYLAVENKCLFGYTLSEHEGLKTITVEQLKAIFPPQLEIWKVDCKADVMDTISHALVHREAVFPKLRQIVLCEHTRYDMDPKDEEKFALAGITLNFDCLVHPKDHRGL